MKPKGSPLLIYEDERFFVEHVSDTAIPGYLFLNSKLEVCLGDLRGEFLLGLGQLIEMTYLTMRDVLGVDKIYILSFGENTRTLHVHFFPRYEWMIEEAEEEVLGPQGINGPLLFQLMRERYQDEEALREKREEMESVSEEIRKRLASGGIEKE
jgi:diadenosine tetraphosphate (Ap4A) HIT family hydrolase